ncbi:MAG: hypothetical protein ACQGQP_09630, partial [Desulfovibrio sp.]
VFKPGKMPLFHHHDRIGGVMEKCLRKSPKIAVLPVLNKEKSPRQMFRYVLDVPELEGIPSRKGDACRVFPGQAHR